VSTNRVRSNLTVALYRVERGAACSMASKRLAQSRGPLDSEAVVQQVLSYVGPGLWLICALINKNHELYAEVQSIEQVVQVYKDLGGWRPERRTITARMTTYSAIFASASRVEMARMSGLKLRSRGGYLQGAAATNGDAETLIAAHKLGLPWTDCLINLIAEQGDLRRVQVLYENKCRLPVEVSLFAARSGSVDMLKWLKHKGCAFTIDTAREAALGGHQEAIMYLHADYWHESWDAVACEAPLKNCHAALLCWLLEQNRTWHVSRYKLEAWMRAAELNKVAALECYAVQWAMPFAARVQQLLNIAGSNGSLAAAQWLRQRGAEWPAVLQYDGKTWSGDTLAWARAEGCDSPLAW
jgi:hypothetical protein